mmetsp:Transcript_24513/g.61688  ORF Transcript_24513/g.61688 Transcript_24513/m.61688 type:complete len:110 (-) Transcript_24513:1270-1599(-)|eukprot:CAMPEP_0178991582 /NCGR_PEP_ID=MMETSP0795-20121207/5614_1 /TAXON_ID=88552 /ORGANISM="Amoebophrya sp., Strain Ameob2" /LENGTH=109 /DNA_ID=CAMNT_0020683319 /DNA_START=459 /DNA_END=788 /DNA_ORIENTATION=+
MGSQWFECVCQFFRAQSENLAGVLQGLGNQNTISDLGAVETLHVPEGPQLVTASPMHLFMLFLAFLWGWMYLQSRQPKVNEKPTGGAAGGGGSDNNPGGNEGGGAGMAN